MEIGMIEHDVLRGDFGVRSHAYPYANQIEPANKKSTYLVKTFMHEGKGGSREVAKTL
jgi:hypothetical protein